ncbi:hypothetical protein GCK32_005422 [Trichostrongylus colubriformis]|uniref:SCP domain-containing protein n=1 Tax=Trichostrongylus colubriformis TaxID=6319 RepID=A0AAN8FLA6_TRICO
MLFLLLVSQLFHEVDAQHICQWTSPLDDVDRSLFVDIHNTYRAYVARGEAYQLGAKLPGSPGLFELKYDCQLELMAQMNTYSCNQTFHPPTTSINYFTLVNEPHAWSKRDLIPIAASSWYQPILDTRNRSDPRLEPFANMMYYKSLSIGCSHNLCPATATTPAINAIACLYTPAHQRNKHIYPEGHYGCVDDADCWKYGAPSSRYIAEGSYHGLCSQGTLGTTTTTITSFSTTSSMSTTTAPTTTQSTTPGTQH